ncbi:hypothetical protein X805_04680 [Sphaerotilus natans subsp. natans DSM 6575]|uniref:Uncharacterized protein n=1 Tax=Sphaerotilus natans subsp. natans DSM 6575 TaxID=1286631 RepID=A0A059KRQ1_9BURK|nr:hypothetical protein [Sphaerotilus natans]KDB53914.1 hypothetical protein X805_04680 [Sphaerotilus natans subsp. natans DSM 6575]SIR68434.1 hypothetical protein SAMN05421778_11487 [Sphaerotilus natans]
MAFPARLPDSRDSSAPRARSAEIYHLHQAAGYEAGVQEPGCWDHIGRHMQADAEPVRRTPTRRLSRPSRMARIWACVKSYAMADVVIAFLFLSVLAATAFGVL